MPEQRDVDAQVIEVVRLLQPGEVVSYGDIAADAGFPRASRQVGRLLAVTDGLPWWRVVTVQGRLVPGNERHQAELLRAEGVLIERGRVKKSPLGRFSPTSRERL